MGPQMPRREGKGLLSPRLLSGCPAKLPSDANMEPGPCGSGTSEHTGSNGHVCAHVCVMAPGSHTLSLGQPEPRGDLCRAPPTPTSAFSQSFPALTRARQRRTLGYQQPRSCSRPQFPLGWCEHRHGGRSGQGGRVLQAHPHCPLPAPRLAWAGSSFRTRGVHGRTWKPGSTPRTRCPS